MHAVMEDVVEQLLNVCVMSNVDRPDVPLDAREFNKKMGAVLKNFVREKNFKQRIFAKRAGVAYQQLQKYMSGDNAIPLYRLYRLMCSLPEEKQKKYRITVKIEE